MDIYFRSTERPKNICLEITKEPVIKISIIFIKIKINVYTFYILLKKNYFILNSK